MRTRKNNSFSNVVVISTFLLFIFSFYGCVTTTGPATRLQISPEFVPQKVYNYNYDTMWNRVLSVLRRERIMVASANKESGIITTDFIPGWTVDVAALSETRYRYMYQIALEKFNASQTRIEIISKLEEKRMLKGGSAREAVEQLKPYQDVTYRMKENAERLEFWLYEQIEKSL